MRPARATAATGRNATLEKQRRARAGSQPLRARYPRLATLQLEFEYSDRTEYIPSPQVTVFHPPAPAYFCFSCPYSDCDGEFDFTAQVDLLANGHESRAEGQARCSGTRHGGVPCTLCLEYSISAHWL
jgi:hypothetical protein